MTWGYLPFIFGLALLNYCIRFIRWHYYLRLSKTPLAFGKSVVVFFSGLSMSITPGKVGEIMKAYFVKTLNGTPMSATFSVVFAERFTDLFAIVLLAAIGAFRFHYGLPIILVGGILVAGILVIIMNRRFAESTIRILSRYHRLTKFSERLMILYDHSHRLLLVAPLSVGLALSLFAWFSECFAFFLVFKSLGIPLSIMTAMFIYAFSTLFGAITMLPGGLASTEGSMAGLLLLRGVTKDTAAAATIVIRIATLWFAVLLGLLWLLPYRRVLARLDSENPEKHGTV